MACSWHLYNQARPRPSRTLFAISSQTRCWVMIFLPAFPWIHRSSFIGKRSSLAAMFGTKQWGQPYRIMYGISSEGSSPCMVGKATSGDTMCTVPSDRGIWKGSEGHAHVCSLIMWKGITCGCLCSPLLTTSGSWLPFESRDTKGMSLAIILFRFCFIVTIGRSFSRSYKAAERELPYAIRFADAPPTVYAGLRM